MDPLNNDDLADGNGMVVSKIPVGVSGTALAASLLRDGWSLAKMYAKYQEAVDALRHEQLGRKESEAVLQRVLCELEEKAGVILDERVEYERMVESYSVINQKLQHSFSEQANLEKTIQELKADLRRHERGYNLAQKEIVDLQKQVTVLLKECRDIQLRCGSSGHDQVDDSKAIAPVGMDVESDPENAILERLTFKDINGLVEQNVQLRSLVRNLSDQIEDKEMAFKEKIEMELKKHTDEAACKVAAVLQRAEEQGHMIESLHTSVAMYKRLYEEEHKLRSSYSRSSDAAPVEEDGRRNRLLLLEDYQEATKKAQEKAAERLRSLEEDLAKSKSDIILLRSERDKMALDAKFARERLDSFMKEFEHQRNEMNGVLSRNVEFSQLIVDHQRKLRESSENLVASEELSRKLNMEVSVLKLEKEILSNAEKRACDEVRSLSERVYRLQATLDTIQSAEEAREEARAAEKRKQEEYVKKIEREWTEAKKELQQERDNVRALTSDREQTLKNAMRQIDDMGKELANTLHAVSAAETRAAVAETKLSELEKKMKVSDAKAASMNDSGISSSISATEVVTDLLMAKDEIQKLKEEARASKEHMLQYKSIAQVNETALKQMEDAHENFKKESEKLKESLENELLSLRGRISELDREFSKKSEEVASAAVGKAEAFASALAEITCLKEENCSKTSQIVVLESQISALKEDLEKEHERWRAAQANYERQVILQSETIQELTKTSQALSLLQQEASDLRKLVDAQKSANVIFLFCIVPFWLFSELILFWMIFNYIVSKLRRSFSLVPLGRLVHWLRTLCICFLISFFNSLQGTSVVQLLSGTILDDLAATYVSAIENFERVALSVSSELGAGVQSVENPLIPDASATVTPGQAVPSQATIVSSVAPHAHLPTKMAEEKERKVPVPKPNVETRKTGRKLVRPRLVRPEEPPSDVEMSEVDGSTSVAKLTPASESETQHNITPSSQPIARKRLASSSSDLNEQPFNQGETSSDVPPPVLKRPKGTDSVQEGSEGQAATLSETLVTLPVVEESAVTDLSQGEEEAVAEKEEVETSGEKAEPPKESEQLDDTTQVEPENETNEVAEEILDKPNESGMEIYDGSKDHATAEDNQQSPVEFENEREEGELVAEVEEGTDMSNMAGSPETGEVLPDTTPVASPARIDDEAMVPVGMESGEINSPEMITDEKNDEGDIVEEIGEGSDKSNDGGDQIAVETDQSPEAASVAGERTTATANTEMDASKQASSSGAEAEEVRQVSPASNTSTVVNLAERARQRAMLRQGGGGGGAPAVLSSPSTRGRGRVLRGRIARGARGGRGGRSGRGQTPGQQG
ncbi:PREDICTED: nuclear-pore anchor-like [Populus euphratica]|uniref:Nuclear-pore anchor-like n=1 Tax=Populus euphratica TaxID=75702 RepID=A0AAJ6XEC6_POPEU|nr:PREDICTED: nuclear-pore anchor-like [Populus euphratica]